MNAAACQCYLIGSSSKSAQYVSCQWRNLAACVHFDSTGERRSMRKIVNNLEITFILLFYYILVFVTQIFSQWDVQYSGVSSPHLDGIVQLSTVMAHDSKWPMTTGYIFFGTTISFMYNPLSFSAEFTFEQKVFYRLHGIFCYQMIWFFRT